MNTFTVPNTSQSGQLRCAEGERCFGSDPMHNAVLAVLDGLAAHIIRFERQSKKFRSPWVYYETSSGKRRATFLSPKEFRDYKWLNNYSVVVNLETGAKYQVDDKSCTCPHWFYAVRTGKQKTCQHQDMRSESIRQSLAKAKQSSPYGVCHQCGSNYDIPGADDANHCPKCGWVEPPLSKVSQNQRGLVAATAPEAFEDFFLAS